MGTFVRKAQSYEKSRQGPTQEMREHVAEQLDEHRDNAAMSRPGKEWVRGWDDWNASQGPNAVSAPERKV
jgi:hypothetical protein